MTAVALTIAWLAVAGLALMLRDAYRVRVTIRQGVSG